MNSSTSCDDILSPNNIDLVLRVSTYEFWGNAAQSTAARNNLNNNTSGRTTIRVCLFDLHIQWVSCPNPADLPVVAWDTTEP